MSKPKRILVPLDETDLSDKVLDFALGTAAWTGADVFLLHVFHSAPTVDPRPHRKSTDAIDAEIDALIHHAIDRNKGRFTIERARIHAQVWSGDIVTSICTACAELEADLVIMGTHGRQGLIDRFTGSATEQVVARAPASVFVVRPDGYPYLQE